MELDSVLVRLPSHPEMSLYLDERILIAAIKIK